MKKLFARIGDIVGLDHGGDRYTYGNDATFGPMASSRLPDQWVRTTCGYCSVGCGMLLGVRDGKAVAVKGDPDHPVNQGRLCPKGLSEHHTLAAPGRLTNGVMLRRPAQPAVSKHAAARARLMPAAIGHALDIGPVPAQAAQVEVRRAECQRAVAHRVQRVDEARPGGRRRGQDGA